MKVLLFFLLAQFCSAHRSVVTRASCDNDFGTSSTALLIPDSGISWAQKHYLDCTHRAVWSKWINTAPNSKFYVGVGIPPRERFADVRADAIIIGPGLPTLSQADIDSLPTEIRNDPVVSVTDVGGYIFRSPADQSTCNHMDTVMSRHTSVVEGRCNFFEPYGQTNSWRVLDEDNNVIPTGGATYYLAVWLQNHTSSKLGIAFGTWVENFWTPYNIITPTCTRGLSDFSEKYGIQPEKFPVTSCVSEQDVVERVEGIIPSSCLSDSTCEECVAAASFCPDSVVYPQGLACDDSISYIAMMGCGGVRCPKAVKHWDTTNTDMHTGMAINFTGEVELDFVRGMVPHHQGALDMCSVLLDKLTCAEWEDLGMLDGMVHFCTHVRLEQEREIGGMNNWLEEKGLALQTQCVHGMDHSSHAEGDHTMSNGCGNVSVASSKDFIEANHLMHGGMGVSLSCDHVTDFVRMMIPHHAGAVRMCEILNEHTTTPDTYLTELCVNITRLQMAEIAWMSEWLHGRNIPTIAPCETSCSNGEAVASEPDLPCEDVIPVSSYCHMLGEKTGDPNYCTCEGVTQTYACGSTNEIQGFGSLVIDDECKRFCGLCPVDRPPLFYEACAGAHDHSDHNMHDGMGHGSHSDMDHSGHSDQPTDTGMDHSTHTGHSHDDHEDDSGSVHHSFLLVSIFICIANMI